MPSMEFGECSVRVRLKISVWWLLRQRSGRFIGSVDTGCWTSRVRQSRHMQWHHAAVIEALQHQSNSTSSRSVDFIPPPAIRSPEASNRVREGGHGR